MKRKILASDFDGTLCHQYTPDMYPASPEVLEAIRQFRAEGGLFGVVTGRDWRWSWYELDQNGKLEFDFIIALNGAQIFNRAGDLIHEVTADGNIDMNGVPMALALARRCWEVVSDCFCISRGRERHYFSPALPEGGEFDGDQYSPLSVLDNLGLFHMAGAIAPHGFDTLKAGEIIREEFGAWVNPQPNGRCMDIPPAGTDKGLAVARYAALMGVDKDDIWTAGDNHNDLAMLRPFHGCAMANGVQAARDAAEYVCRDIAEVIETIRKAK